MTNNTLDEQIDELLNGWLGRAKGFVPSDPTIPAEEKTKHTDREQAKRAIKALLAQHREQVERKARLDLAAYIYNAEHAGDDWRSEVWEILNQQPELQEERDENS